MSQQKFIHVDNKKICYSVNHHSSSSKTIVFLHGVGGCLHVWQPYMDKFKQDYHVLSIDLRGHGFSYRPTAFDEYLAVNQVDDVFKVLEKEGLTNITIIGHSFGAMLAMLYSKRYPEITDKIILLGIGDDIPSAYRMLSRIPLVYPILKCITSLLPRNYLEERRDYSTLLNTSEFSLKRMWSDIRHTSLKSYYMSFLAVKDYNGKEYAQGIECSALVVSAEGDTLFPPEAGARLSACIKKSQHVTINNCGHNFIVDKAELLMKKIAQPL